MLKRLPQIACLLLVLVIGCSSDEGNAVPMTQVSGTVSEGGQAVPKDKYNVVIVTDDGKGNSTLSVGENGEFSGEVVIGKSTLYVVPKEAHAEMSSSGKTVKDVAKHQQAIDVTEDGDNTFEVKF